MSKRNALSFVFLLIAALALESCSFRPWTTMPEKPEAPAWEDIYGEQYAPNYPRYDPASYPPRTLLFSDMDLIYLRDTARFWRNRVGIDGFILPGIFNWYERPEKIWANYNLLQEANRECVIYGIDANFIKVALGYRALPRWDDETSWRAICDRFGVAASLAFRTGCRGIVIDTEPYTKPLWDPMAERFEGRPVEELEKAVHRVAEELMDAMLSSYPEIEIMVIPDGAYRWFRKSDPTYRLWIHFFNGLAASLSSGGVIVGTESSYHARSREMITWYYCAFNGIMLQHAEDPIYWQRRCGIALGGWPLGYYREVRDEEGRVIAIVNKKGEPAQSKSDKSSYYPPEEFEEQMRTFESLCSRYIWIYAHGSAWWQVDPVSYPHLVRQSGPLDPLIEEYYDVVKRSELPGFRDYILDFIPDQIQLEVFP